MTEECGFEGCGIGGVVKTLIIIYIVIMNFLREVDLRIGIK